MEAIVKGEFLFLGTGGSAGIPVIGCSCAVCTSLSPYNQRWRSSGLILAGGKAILIDVGPEFRLQALKYQINHLDAVLLTHAHADHIAGIDDLRSYFFLTGEKMPCVLSQATFDEVSLRYHYLLKPLHEGKNIAAQIDFSILEKEFGKIEVAGIPIQYFTYYQLGTQVTGFRVGNFAYVSDIREYSEALIEALEGVEILVLSALRQTPTRMHFSVEEAVAFAKRINAKKTYLTHIAHELDHEATNALLPEEVQMSYDGLKISFEW